MVEMAVGASENELRVSRLRRNSTGSLGIEMGEYKVMSRYLSVPTGSCHDACKSGYESDSMTKPRIPLPTRCGAPLGKIRELARSMKLETTKKPLSSTKLTAEIKSQTSCQVNGQEIPISKRTAAFVNHQNNLKMKPLEENASSPLSRSHQLSNRRYSDIIIPRRSSNLQESVSDGSCSGQNNKCRIDKESASSDLGKKKSVTASIVSWPPKSSVKKVSSTKSSNNSPRKVPQPDKRTNLTRSKLGLVSNDHVQKKTLHIIGQKAKSPSIGLSRENRNTKESSLDRDSPKRGKTASSPLLSPCSSLPLSGSSSNCIDTSQSSVSSCSSMPLLSTSADESLDSDATGASTRQSETRAEKIGSGNEDCGPKMLNFRRPKLIDIHSDKAGPRRLELRHVNIEDESENENGGDKGKSSRTPIADDQFQSNPAKDEVMQVNLRSQAKEDKKEPPSLLNNVIEVAANKLVETRRSKVKALVGAFETVISLQDRKSSTPTWRS